MLTSRLPRLRRATGLVLALVAISMLAACGPLAGPTATATPAGVWVIPAELEGTSWRLIELNGQPLVAGTEITLTLAEGRVSGSTGCNTYAGPLVVDPAATPPAVGFSLTKRACVEDGVMQQEQAYISALSGAAGRSLVDGRLEFRDAAGAPTLVFEPAAT